MGMSDTDASNVNNASDGEGAWGCEKSRLDQAGKAKFSPTINFVSSFRECLQSSFERSVRKPRVCVQRRDYLRVVKTCSHKTRPLKC